MSQGRPGVPKLRVRRPRPSFDDTDLLIFGAKACTKCGAVLPANSEQFYADPTCVTGLTSRCRSCRCEDDSLADRRERRRQRDRERYAADPEFRAYRIAKAQEFRRRKAPTLPPLPYATMEQTAAGHGVNRPGHGTGTLEVPMQAHDTTVAP